MAVDYPFTSIDWVIVCRSRLFPARAVSPPAGLSTPKLLYGLFLRISGRLRHSAWLAPLPALTRVIVRHVQR